MSELMLGFFAEGTSECVASDSTVRVFSGVLGRRSCCAEQDTVIICS